MRIEWILVPERKRLKHEETVFSVLCVLALCLTLLPATALAADVTYVKRGWNGSVVTKAEKTATASLDGKYPNYTLNEASSTQPFAITQAPVPFPRPQ